MESVLIIRITCLDTDRILIPGVNGVIDSINIYMQMYLHQVIDALNKHE